MVKKREVRKREQSPSDNEYYGFDEADDIADDLSEEEEVSPDEEVFGLVDSDDLGDDENIEDAEQDMGSDIAEDEKVVDERAWGKSNRRFYNTDYVDDDYEGFYVGKEAEEAELEEQEAKQIQKRLVEQLNEADFDITNFYNVPKSSETDAFEEIQRDVSTLSKRQKLDLLQKESPEFFKLVKDFKSKLAEINELLPILSYLENKQETLPALKFLKKKFLILTNYCTNVSFYLLLKAKGNPIQNHPVLKCLIKYRKLLEQIQSVDEVINPEIENMRKAVGAGEKPLFHEDVIGDVEKKKNNILELLAKCKVKKDKVDGRQMETSALKQNKDLTDKNVYENELKDEDVNVNQNGEDGKRAITYEMAKNKGLVPRRNKDQRNPRVRHRKKYRKALIRRRGQVRIPRKEIPVYGGEASGINIGVRKSIKLK